MITLDDVIAVRHLIVCRYCAISEDDPQDAVFTNMNNWLNHKHLTGHRKDSHSVAIVGDEFEVVHTFNPYL